MIDVRLASKNLGYQWFTGPSNLNLYVVRSVETKPGRFDDILGLAGEDEHGVYFNRLWVATVDAGEHYHQNFFPGQSACAVYAPGFYRSVYTLGSHYDQVALVQTGPIEIFRDSTRDGQINPSTERSTGLFGMNIHGPWAYDSALNKDDAVGNKSAGCIVNETQQGHAQFIAFYQRFQAQNRTLSIKVFSERKDGI